MIQDYKLIGIGVVVFKVLAWVALVLQLGVGVYLLIAGGEPVLVNNIEVPARVFGILSFVQGVIVFFMFTLLSVVLRLLLDLHTHVTKRTV